MSLLEKVKINIYYNFLFYSLKLISFLIKKLRIIKNFIFQSRYK